MNIYLDKLLKEDSMKFKINKRSALSLGEALITLGIIGLVAAITIPSLRVIIPDKNETLTKKGNYILEHTLSDVINNEDYYPVKKEIIVKAEGEDETKKTFGLRNTDRAVGTNCEGTSKFCCLMAKNLKLYPGTSADCTADKEYNFKTADGIEWKMPISGFTSGEAQEIRFRTLDRGASKNCYKVKQNNTCEKPNILLFQVTSEGKLYSYVPSS